ncbi:DNA fragmentation factor subunit beta isoform X2 [Heterodontus francisci]|uniref:DNA fragmentation factor subunit beta isoform X2 n=1 Tax=Heterodontus francisci TaxID=7792 RepID=UPI00355BFDBA
MGSKFKVRSLKTDTKYGIVARNLEELMQKGCQKLQLPRKKCRVCLFKSGTEVDAENFSHLEDNCELIILQRGQQWNGEGCYYLNKVLHGLDTNEEFITIARQILSDELSPKKRTLLQKLIESSAENITAEKRQDDQEWFKGLDSHFQTKSAYMRSSCKRRMRNYLSEVKKHADKLERKTKEKYCAFVTRIERQLQQNHFNECYFDRTANDESRLCTDRGWFTCQGAFDEDSCNFFHSINPYGNRQNRIIFSTWNLDHRIEKKRTIIPEIVKSVIKQETDDSKAGDFYSLLFTLDNLKLVHIVCHKKIQHNLSCDSSQIYTRKKRKIHNLHPL